MRLFILYKIKVVSATYFIQGPNSRTRVIVMAVSGKSACFGGCPPDHFSFPFEAECTEYIALQAEITRAIVRAIRMGYSNFFSGLRPGFDLVCVGILLEARDIDPRFADIRLTAVWSRPQKDLPGIWPEVYRVALERADEVLTIPPGAPPIANLECAHYMVKKSGLAICYFDGQDPETAYMINQARRYGLDIIDLGPFTD